MLTGADVVGESDLSSFSMIERVNQSLSSEEPTREPENSQFFKAVLLSCFLQTSLSEPMLAEINLLESLAPDDSFWVSVLNFPAFSPGPCGKLRATK